MNEDMVERSIKYDKELLILFNKLEDANYEVKKITKMFDDHVNKINSDKEYQDYFDHVKLMRKKIEKYNSDNRELTPEMKEFRKQRYEEISKIIKTLHNDEEYIKGMEKLKGENHEEYSNVTKR